MHDAALVRRRECVQHAQQHRHGLLGREGGLLAAGLCQRGAFDVLKDEVALALVLVGFEHGHDVGVGQAADRARLGQPFVQGLGVGGRVEQLERDLAVQARVVRQPHRGLRAAAQYTLQHKAAEPADVYRGLVQRVAPLSRPARSFSSSSGACWVCAMASGALP